MVEISKKNVAFSEYMNFNRNHRVSQPVGIFRVDQKAEDKFIQGVLCLRCFLRLWKNNRVSRKPSQWRSDLVLNGQMRVPK